MKNNKTVVVWTDVHLFAPNQLMTPKEFVQVMNFNPYEHGSTLLIGDIWDRVYCPKKQLPELEEQYAMFKKTLGPYMVSGNHSLVSPIGEFIKINDTVFTHGDLESSPERWTKYREKEHGLPGGPWGFFKKNVWSIAKEKFEEMRESSIDNEFLERCYQLCLKVGASHYVCGHKHPKKRVETTYKGVKITVLPRGRSEVQV